VQTRDAVPLAWARQRGNELAEFTQRLDDVDQLWERHGAR
jgi:hypothetical protein